jgi:hypothetical protein
MTFRKSENLELRLLTDQHKEAVSVDKRNYTRPMSLPVISAEIQVPTREIVPQVKGGVLIASIIGADVVQGLFVSKAVCIKYVRGRGPPGDEFARL